MDNKFEQFIAAYQNANQDIKDIIDSETIGLMIDNLLTQYPQYQSLKSKLLILTSNLLLEIITVEELESSITTLGVEQGVMVFLSTQIQSEITKYKQGNVTIIRTPEETPAGTEPIINYQETSTNPLVRPLPQSPYAEVPTYQSSQADLYPIRKRPGADDPKWGA